MMRRTRFWLSRNQCEVAAANPETYRIRRIYRFRNGAKMFDIKPPLDVVLLLTPDKYTSVPKSAQLICDDRRRCECRGRR